MSVGFGFSAGDFIAALQLVATVIDALRESGNSSTEFRELLSQLDTLQSALQAVNRIELNDVPHVEVIALQQAAAQCQRTIDGFWEKIKRYQPSLRREGSGSRVKDGWMKIKWALCRKEDVVRFKADLVGHTESIDMLLTTVQMAATRIDSKKSEERHQTLAGRLQDSYFGCMQRIGLVLERVSTGIQQGKQLLDMTAKVIQTNVQIFQILVSVQNVVTRIPGQVERQQPVYLIDAIGRHMAFHLEFVLSAEALTAVLRSNFRNVGAGAKKIERGEFVIQDAATKQDINLASPWETCFSPGQRTEMSMIFKSAKWLNLSCPKCHDENRNNAGVDKDIECQKCNMVYRRSLSVTLDPPSTSSLGVSSTEHNEVPDFAPEHPPSSSSRKRHRPHDEEKEMALFRRVRIKTEMKMPAVKPRKKPPAPQLDPNDPYSDPEYVRMLEAEKAAEEEPLDQALGTQSETKMPTVKPRKKPLTPQTDPNDPYSDPEYIRMLEAKRALDDEIAADILGGKYDKDWRVNADLEYEKEMELHKDQFEAELADMAEYDLDMELQNEAMVEQELYDMERAAEVPSDSDYEKFEDSEDEGSEDNDEDIDMDYRFS